MGDAIRRPSYGNPVSSAAVTPGAPGTGEVIVANEAAASAIAGLVDGQQVFIKSHRSWWRFNANSPAPLVAHVVIASASAGASPRLLRTAYAAPEWRESITDVYIDPANTTGIASDENQAIFSAPQVGNARQPLLTWQELFRRWGDRNVINTGDLVNLTFQIHVISSNAAPDCAALDWINFVDTFPRIIGEANTVLLAGNLDGAGGFTAQNPAVPAPGGTPCQIKVGATVWAPYLKKRIRFTATGAVAYIIKDLGGGTALISQPQLTNEATFAATPTNVNPANGTAFLVEDLVNIVTSDHLSFGFEGSASAFFGQVNTLDVNIVALGGAGSAPMQPALSDFTSWIFYQCTFDRQLSLSNGLDCNGCGARQFVTTQQNGGGAGAAGSGNFYGGAIMLTGSVIPIVFLAGDGGQFFASGRIDFYTYVHAGPVCLAGTAKLGLCAVFDVPVLAAINAGGHAICIGGTKQVPAVATARFVGATAIFGTGNAGSGVHVEAGSKGIYTTLPNIQGAADITLADSAAAWYFAASIYNPIGAGIALSWANIAAARPAGFGGSAHEPDLDAHFMKESAT